MVWVSEVSTELEFNATIKNICIHSCYTHDPTADSTSDRTSDPTQNPTADLTSGPTSEPSFDSTVDLTKDSTMDPIQERNHPTVSLCMLFFCYILALSVNSNRNNINNLKLI